MAQQCGSLDAAQAAVTTWSELIGAVDQDVVELLGKVRAWAPVVLVSNATTRLESDLAHLGLFDSVDGVVSSARIGVAKPEPGIYLAAARSVGAEPELCLFIDDTLGHVEGARAEGMTAVHYTGMESLRDVVR